MIRVLLVDDQALVRAGFRVILEAEDDIEVVGDASDGDQAVVSTRHLRPDVVLMDIQMPRMDGLEATMRIVQDTEVRSRVVILTTFERDDYVFEALRAGASGALGHPAGHRGVLPAPGAPHRRVGRRPPPAHRAGGGGAQAAGDGQEQRRARRPPLPG